MNNISSLCDPKIRTYSTTMNMKTHIILSIDFQRCGHEDFFTKIYSHVGVQISKLLYLQLKIMSIRRHYERVNKKNTYVKILGSQMIQQKTRDKNLKQTKDETKGSFHGSGCCIDPIFEVEEKIRAKSKKSTLKGCDQI